MASHFQIQKPYVLASLPRPLDPTTGRYVVSEVYGSAPGSRKRKRHELAVGIDGEAVNIYNVSSARLVTSYPVPPQSSFSCSIASIRRKVEGTQEVSRHTYAATRESHENKVTLFKDYVDASGNTDSIAKSVSLGVGRPIICVAPIAVSTAQRHTNCQTLGDELLIVREDGEVICLNPDTLERKWNSSPAVLQQDLPTTSKLGFSIISCYPVLLSDLVQGIFKGSDDAFGLFPEIKQGLNTDAEVLVLISSHELDGQQSRRLHVLSIIPPSHDSSSPHQQGVIQLHAVPIPTSAHGFGTASYRLDIRSGSLIEFRGQAFNIYDLTTSIPRITSTIELSDATSFLRLSKTSLLCSTPTHLSIYNPIYRSFQNSVRIDSGIQDDSTANPKPAACLLAAYFSRLELAVAIIDANLVAIQLEAPILRTRKRRAEGLLIDSIGRGVQLPRRPSAQPTQPSSEEIKTSLFSNYIPGSIRGDYWESWATDEAKADALLNTNDIRGLELMLAQKFSIQVQNAVQMPNGVGQAGEGLSNPPKYSSTWIWPKTRAAYPPVDRRWIVYAISRAFQWNDSFRDDPTIPRLICQLPQSDIVNYLVDAGHLTLSNLKTSFREVIRDDEKTDSFLAEQIVLRLADVDPTLELLVSYISATNLGATELVIAVRTIMRSLELVQDPKQLPPKLLTNGTTEEIIENGEANGDGEGEGDSELSNIGMELDNLEDEIQRTVSYLDEDAGIRGSGLSVAFAKLGNCPNISMIKALRATFKPEEILSLIYLLRVELVRGAWTSRYLDITEFEKDANLDAPPDGVIKLIADLLGRCVDSIGPGGWLLNDAVLAADETGDFVASLKFEVSAALEGLEEAVYLRGVISEAVRYCESSKKTKVEGVVDKMRPIPLHVKDPGSQALPLGLKAKGGVSAQKVVSGGEVVDRSQRETGHLRSQQVGHYSLERIAI
ncbi:uncharacterized protein GGS22DRAFT_79422 [Annulohypoxylon maeteangense]|uniref:uncharacterized protein n=1 Tax=Annulohypoxylon maeteangense TaxID=1927788 RepID=UPI002007A840|nr:uncharacterized protein GGS22DRAFT_79422 [Annulohypoxylon maeteangense]KAI0880738.1 hypothetical protein GGS22DRAFT_79422 [Annulohypoxylon maeteangense]